MDVNLSGISPGTLYASPLGQYVVTEATYKGAYVSVALKPSGHAGAPFTTKFSTLTESSHWSAR